MSTLDSQPTPLIQDTPGTLTKQENRSVEFFHIYTDEKIAEIHNIGLEYLRTIEKTWPFKYDRIVLIDNYNPTDHSLTPEEVFSYLENERMPADYWAYEGDLLDNAKKLLDSIQSPKLQRSYRSYIDRNNKYPCSLLTATWYLTRLGKLNYQGIIKTVNGQPDYEPSEKLLNILPSEYKKVEKRAREIIAKSVFEAEIHNIQDMFYQGESGRALDLF